MISHRQYAARRREMRKRIVTAFLGGDSIVVISVREAYALRNMGISPSLAEQRVEEWLREGLKRRLEKGTRR